MAIDLAPCMKCPSLKIPCFSGFTQVFYAVAVTWPAQCSSGAISGISRSSHFSLLPSPGCPCFGAWKGSALHRASGTGGAFGSAVTAADSATDPGECFRLRCALVGGKGVDWKKQRARVKERCVSIWLSDL